MLQIEQYYIEGKDKKNLSLRLQNGKLIYSENCKKLTTFSLIKILEDCDAFTDMKYDDLYRFCQNELIDNDNLEFTENDFQDYHKEKKNESKKGTVYYFFDTETYVTKGTNQLKMNMLYWARWEEGTDEAKTTKSAVVFGVETFT